MTLPVYASDAMFRLHIRDPSALDPIPIGLALDGASREVEHICGRRFYQTTGSQYFSPAPRSPWIIELDDVDLANTTGLVVAVQWSNTANYNETWTLNTDFVVEPRNQSVNGIDGWPYTSLRSLSKIWPPRIADFYLDTVKVTGTFGWPAIPAPVTQATLMLAAERFKSGEAPWGVAGFSDFGAVRVRENPMVASMLAPYKKHTSLMMA